jgi:hypothetical protein
MRTSLVISLAIAAAATPVLAGQASTTPGQSHGARAFTAPRTPWGDPDISGNLTNVFEASTPLERPDSFAGRRLEDVQGEELASFRLGLQQRTLSNFEGPLHGPDHWWQDAYDLRKGGQAWFVIDPPDGKVPPLTPEAERRRSAAGPRGSYTDDSSWRGPEDFNLYDRCITRGLPGSMMPAIYGNSYRITQAPGIVAIQYEMIHETRLIPLDGRPHVGRNIRLDMGDAQGRWEGDTLVVETTNFRSRSAYRNASADTLRIVERFRRVAPDKIMWAVTVDDPATWTRPWTLGMPLTIADNEPMQLYECHEGNYGLRNMLEIARAADKSRPAESRADLESHP